MIGEVLVTALISCMNLKKITRFQIFSLKIDGISVLMILDYFCIFAFTIFPCVEVGDELRNYFD